VQTVQKAADLAVQAGSRLYTDSASSYRVVKGYLHEYVNHTQKEHARGDVHENRAQCLFSLLKPYLRVFRGLSKTGVIALFPTQTDQQRYSLINQTLVQNIVLLYSPGSHANAFDAGP
jgi:hypothetical protein